MKIKEVFGLGYERPDKAYKSGWGGHGGGWGGHWGGWGRSNWGNWGSWGGWGRGNGC